MNADAHQPKIFYCFRFADRTQALTLIDQHARDGKAQPPYLLDHRADWRKAAVQQIQSAEEIVVLCTSMTANSPNVVWELEQARTLKKPVRLVGLHESGEQLMEQAARTGLSAKDLSSFCGRLAQLQVQHDLINGAVTPADPASLLTQYSIMVNSWEALINRRQVVNTLYVSACGAILTAIGVLVSLSKDTYRPLLWAVAGGLAMLGAFMALTWRLTLDSYGKLSTEKSRVVQALEEHLPAKLFTAEWQQLIRVNYRSTTRMDKGTTLGFMVIFMAVCLASGYLAWDARQDTGVQTKPTAASDKAPVTVADPVSAPSTGTRRSP